MELQQTNDGGRITAKPGTIVRVTLPTTFWEFAPLTAGSPLDLIRDERSTTPNCIPGGGCGSSVAEFKAVALGTQELTASRHQCGEAVRCLPGQDAFKITVTVAD